MLQPRDPPLTDGVVTLRPLAAGDLDGIEALHKDGEVRYWTWRGAPPYTARELVMNAPVGWQRGTAASFAIVARKRFAGMLHASVRNVPVMRDAELGYMLLADARGNGYATRAVQLVSRWLLDDVGLVRVQARTNPDNPTSSRVLERAGFRREGVARLGAVYPATDEAYDTLMWSLVRGDIG